MNAAARFNQPVKLFHRLDNIIDVFNNVNGAQAIEAVGGERVREAVEIGQYIRAGVRIVVQTDRTRELI